MRHPIRFATTAAVALAPTAVQMQGFFHAPTTSAMASHPCTPNAYPMQSVYQGVERIKAYAWTTCDVSLFMQVSGTLFVDGGPMKSNTSSCRHTSCSATSGEMELLAGTHEYCAQNFTSFLSDDRFGTHQISAVECVTLTKAPC